MPTQANKPSVPKTRQIVWRGAAGCLLGAPQIRVRVHTSEERNQAQPASIRTRFGSSAGPGEYREPQTMGLMRDHDLRRSGCPLLTLHNRCRGRLRWMTSSAPPVRWPHRSETVTRSGVGSARHPAGRFTDDACLPSGSGCLQVGSARRHRLGAAPAVGPPRVVVGQPTGPGAYVVRVKVPWGVKLMPHWHPEDRVHTVMSGVCTSAWANSSTARSWRRIRLVASSSARWHPHFHWAESGAYVTQVTAIGPLGLEYLDPKDDPRNN